MKKTIIIILSLALCAGLFCFIYFSKNDEPKETKTETRLEENSDSHASRPAIQTSQEVVASTNALKEDVKKEEKKDNEENEKIEEAHFTICVPEAAKNYDAGLSSLARVVIDSLEINNKGFSYHHPFVPNDIHLGVKLQVFEKIGAGDITLFRYVSDSGWINDGYKSNERFEKISFDEEMDINNLTVVIEIKVFNEDGLLQLYDGYIENGKLVMLSEEVQE